MLRARLLTAAILIPLVVWGVIALPPPLFALFLAVIVVVGAWEWAGLLGWSKQNQRLGYLMLVLATLIGANSLMNEPWAIRAVMILSVIWWLLCLLWIINYQRGRDTLPRSPILLGLAGLLVMIPGWLGLVAMRNSGPDGPYWVVLLFLLIWCADSTAYVTGRRWGKTRLADKVSPGKTWEGVGGAALAGTLLGSAYALANSLGLFNVLLMTALCLLTIMFSVVGDLLESLFKRRAGVKDSGDLLPGHGGVLDRIDSLTAAAPVFALGLTIFGERL